MGKIGYISDLHIDIWKDEYKELNDDVFFNKLIANTEGINSITSLIIVGDMSNKNKDTIEFLKRIFKYTNIKKVFIQDGNHEYYLNQNKPNNRFKDLISECNKLFGESVVILNQFSGIHNIEDKKIAGANIWYNVYNESIEYSFLNVMNDSFFVTKDWVLKQNKLAKEFYNNVIQSVDIFVSHTPFVLTDYSAQFIDNNCYYTPMSLYEGKTYVFGHSHTILDKNQDGARILFNTVGYPNENQYQNISIKII